MNSTPSLYAAMINTKLDNILNVHQIEYLSDLNSSVNQQIISFLNANNNDRGKLFVYQAIQGLMEGAFSSFNSIMVSERDYLDNPEVVSSFPLIKYPVNLEQQYRNQYPKLTEYLENQLPKVANISKIVNAIHEFTTLPIDQIKHDLQWGQGPEINIIQLDNYDENTDDDTVAYFDKDNHPNKIFLDVDYVNCIENGCSLIDAQFLKDSDALIFWIGTTILHEYVHYGDYAQGFEYPGEEGLKFEVRVYGHPINPDTARFALDRINN